MIMGVLIMLMIIIVGLIDHIEISTRVLRQKINKRFRNKKNSRV